MNFFTFYHTFAEMLSRRFFRKFRKFSEKAEIVRFLIPERILTNVIASSSIFREIRISFFWDSVQDRIIKYKRKLTL